MAEVDAQGVMAFLREHRAEMVRFLIDLVRAESPSTDPAAQQPVFDQLEKAGISLVEQLCDVRALNMMDPATYDELDAILQECLDLTAHSRS